MSIHPGTHREKVHTHGDTQTHNISAQYTTDDGTQPALSEAQMDEQPDDSPFQGFSSMSINAEPKNPIYPPLPRINFLTEGTSLQGQPTSE